MVFDPRLLDQRRRRARAMAAPGADFLLRAVADDIVDRLGAVKREFGLAADLGTPGPHLAAALRGSGQVGHVVRIDRLAEAGRAEMLTRFLLNLEKSGYFSEVLLTRQSLSKQRGRKRLQFELRLKEKA